jgi:hypothetical protein
MAKWRFSVPREEFECALPEKPPSSVTAVVALAILLSGWVHPGDAPGSVVVASGRIAALGVVTECDREAADPWDRNRVVEGVPFQQVDGDRAVQVCQRALANRPDDLRLT